MVAARFLTTIKGLARSHDPEQFLRTEHLQADLKGRTIRGGAVTVGSRIAIQLLGIGATVVLARLLTPNEHGLFAMVVAITGFVRLFNDLGLSTVTMQLPEINQKQISLLFWINVGLGAGLALVVIALAPAIAWFYNEPRLVEITMVMSSGFLLGGLTVQHSALLKRQMRFSALSAIEIITGAINIVAAVVAAAAGLGYWALVFLVLAGAPFRVLAIWFVCRWRPGLPGRAEGMRSMLTFGSNLTGYKFLNYLVRNMDNVLIGRFYGQYALGLYAKAYGLLLMPIQMINLPMADVAIPALSRVTDSPERYRKAYAGMVANVCLFTMPLVAFMIGTSDWLVITVLGSQWTEASTIFAWLAVSGLIEPFAFTTIWLFVSQGRTHQQLRWGFISAGVILTAFAIGLPWGATGVAAAYGLASLFVRAPLLFWYVGREGPVKTRDLYRILAPFACASGTTLLAIFALRYWMEIGTPIFGLVLAGATTAAVSLLTLAILPSGRPVLSELKNMPKILLKKETPAWS